MNIQKVSQYFFIIAAVVSILDGAFSLNQDMKAAKFVVLILSGIIVGLLKHSEESEFLVSGVAVVITGYVLIQLIGTYFFLEGIGLMLLNFIVFLSSALVVVGIHQVGGSLTFPELFEDEKKNKKKLSHTNPKKKKLKHFSELTKKEISKLTPQEVRQLKFQHAWGIFILFIVAITFIILLAEMFFDTSQYDHIIVFADIVITVVFLIDLFILYQESDGFSDFVKHNVFDIVAAIPTVGVLRSLKIIRVVRVIKSLRGTFHLSKVLKMYKTTKFFSEESYFNQLETESKNKK